MTRITAIVPAHNEEAGIGLTLLSLAAQGVTDVLVVCDNCTDLTADVALSMGASVIHTVDNTARKAGALNQGLRHLSGRSGEFVLAMDADTVLEPGWVDTALATLDARPAVGAVGAIFQADRDTGFLRRCQALEWHRFARECSRTGRTFVLSGTAALIRWDALDTVKAVFGNYYSPDAITEDFDMTVRLLRSGWELASPDACRTTTETMPTWADLFRQRRRWSLGAVQTVLRHGWSRTTRVYWGQQGMLLLSIIAMGLLMTLTGVGAASGTLSWSPVWAAIGSVFIIERVLTVWDRPWRDRLFAALVVPELVYALVLQISHVAALGQAVTGSTGTWAHVNHNTTKEN